MKPKINNLIWYETEFKEPPLSSDIFGYWPGGPALSNYDVAVTGQEKGCLDEMLYFDANGGIIDCQPEWWALIQQTRYGM